MAENAEKSIKKDGMTDMTQGSPIKLILTFALPLLIGNIAQQMYNLTDTIIVGKFAENGDDCIAAVGNAMPIMFLLVAVLINFTGGDYNSLRRLFKFICLGVEGME